MNYTEMSNFDFLVHVDSFMNSLQRGLYLVWGGVLAWYLRSITSVIYLEPLPVPTTRECMLFRL